MVDFTEKLMRYATLAVNVGVNLQVGQTLVITAPVSAVEFVRLVVIKAYQAGAHNVHVEWEDDEITRIKYEHAPDAAFHEFPAFKAIGWESFAANNAAFLTIIAPNPDLLHRTLHYIGPGTDLRIDLSPKHRWVSDADNINEKGISFLANIPSEEIWTVPLKEGINGTVRSTKPLSYEGYLVQDFSLTFKNGKPDFLQFSF